MHEPSRRDLLKTTAIATAGLALRRVNEALAGTNSLSLCRNIGNNLEPMQARVLIPLSVPDAQVNGAGLITRVVDRQIVRLVPVYVDRVKLHHALVAADGDGPLLKTS